MNNDTFHNVTYASDQLAKINTDLKPLLDRTFQHPMPPITPEEQHALRENLLMLHAQTVMLQAAAQDLRNERRNKTRFQKLFKK